MNEWIKCLEVEKSCVLPRSELEYIFHFTDRFLQPYIGWDKHFPLDSISRFSNAGADIFGCGTNFNSIENDTGLIIKIVGITSDSGI